MAIVDGTDAKLVARLYDEMRDLATIETQRMKELLVVSMAQVTSESVSFKSRVSPARVVNILRAHSSFQSPLESPTTELTTDPTPSCHEPLTPSMAQYRDAAGEAVMQRIDSGKVNLAVV